MNDAIKSLVNTKTTDSYKIIEEKYLILKRYLRMLIKENRLEIQNVECILNALDPMPLIFYPDSKELEENDKDSGDKKCLKKDTKK